MSYNDLVIINELLFRTLFQITKIHKKFTEILVRNGRNKGGHFRKNYFFFVSYYLRNISLLFQVQNQFQKDIFITRMKNFEYDYNFLKRKLFLYILLVSFKFILNSINKFFDRNLICANQIAKFLNRIVAQKQC